MDSNGNTPKSYLIGLTSLFRMRLVNYFLSSKVISKIIKILDRILTRLGAKPFYKGRKGIFNVISQPATQFALHEPRKKFNIISKQKPDIFALYLPQFHQMEVNDLNWGVGFTEWTNVTASRPLFTGHLQPFLPKDFGFYDLTTPGVIEKQVQLAKSYGIDGFVVFIYWFENFAEMDKPLANLFAVCERENFKIAFEWANEPWTRKWDGLEDEKLIDQPKIVSNRSLEAMLSHYSRYMNSKIYYKFEGKSVFFVYNPGYFISDWIPNFKKSFESKFGNEVLLVGMQTFGAEHQKIIEMGFDESAEYFPHNWNKYDVLAKGFRLSRFTEKVTIHDYEKSVEIVASDPRRNGIPNTFPSWDNSPRKRFNGADVFVNCKSKTFELWFTDSVDRAISRGDLGKVPMVLVNAWNEWAEGAILEPSKECGFAYLNAIGRTLERLP